MNVHRIISPVICLSSRACICPAAGMEEGRALEQTPRLAVGKRVEQNTWQVSGSEDASKKTRHLKVQYLSVSFFS